MTDRCDLCDRAMVAETITPHWWPHGPICERRRCRRAAKEAVAAVVASRYQHAELVSSMLERHNTQGAPIGYRTDAFSRDDLLGESWWAVEAAKGRNPSTDFIHQVVSGLGVTADD